MTKRRRLAAPALRLAAGAACASLALAWPLAGPASADDFPVNIRTPADGASLTASTVTVAGTVAPLLFTSVERIYVEILNAGGSVADQGWACDPCAQAASIEFSRSFPLPPTNGAYQARVTASGSFLLTGIPVTGSATRRFSVGAPSAAPTGVRAERLADGNVRVSWNAVPEPVDFIGYVVYRARAGGDFEAPFHGVRENFLVDDSAPSVGGRLQYLVAAIRPGAAPGSANWIQARSGVATIDLPEVSPPAAPPSGDTDSTSTTAALGAAPAGPPVPGAANVDLGAFLNANRSNVTLPSPSSATTLQLPDTGFSPMLPFPSDLGQRAAGGDQGRPNSASAMDEVEDGTAEGLPESNRRALLVPVAAGSVLCVTALHLRWLSRRLVVSPADAAFGGGDLEHADVDLDLQLEGEDLERGREPVGAGAGAAGPHSSR